MIVSQPVRRNAPATGGEERNRHVVLELPERRFSSKIPNDGRISPFEGAREFSPVKDQFCVKPSLLLSLWGQDTFTIIIKVSSGLEGLQPGEALLGPQESVTFDVAVSGSACGHDMARNAAEHDAAIISAYAFSPLPDPAEIPGTCR
jgi:hypothetical protein